MTKLVTQNTKAFLNMAYIRQNPECMRQLKSPLEKHERYSLISRRSDVSHSALTGCVKTNNNTSYSWARSTKGRQKILIFPSTKLTSVSEQQYSTPIVTKSVIDRSSNTVVNATFRLHSNV
jgi:hypothetical protein